MVDLGQKKVNTCSPFFIQLTLNQGFSRHKIFINLHFDQSLAVLVFTGVLGCLAII